MSLAEFHGRLASSALLFCSILALWGFWRFFRRQGVSPAFWGAAAVVEILILVQGALGLYLWIAGARPARSVHWLYGAALALAVPLVYSLTRGRQERPEMLMYAVAFLVMVFLVLRGMVTAG